MPDKRTFSATSPAGDLSEALRGAVSAATQDLNANYFTWRVQNIAGSVGGFVGAHDVTVTIEVGQPVEALALDSEKTEQCGDWYAWQDRMAGKRPSLHVVGRCVFATGGYRVELRPRAPQGFNPAIYMLDKTVTPPSGPATQQITEVPIHYREETSTRYSDVHITPDNVVIPVQELC